MVVYVVFSGHDCEDWGMDEIFATRADAERYRGELLAEAEEDEDKDFDVSVVERQVR
jgi:hypothetical protein